MVDLKPIQYYNKCKRSIHTKLKDKDYRLDYKYYSQ